MNVDASASKGCLWKTEANEVLSFLWKTEANEGLMVKPNWLTVVVQRKEKNREELAILQS